MSISWSSLAKENNSFSGGKFLITKPGQTYNIRPLGVPYIFKKYMLKHLGKWRSAVCLDENKCPVAKKHNVKPNTRCAINVLDLDTGEIKIFENSVNTFRQFKTFLEKTGKNPGGTEGAKYQLKISNGANNYRKYELNYLGPHTLDQKTLKEIEKKGLYKLSKVYKATDPKEIEKVLFDIDDKKSNKVSTENKEETFSLDDII